MALLAAFSFAVLPGCSEPSDTATTTEQTSDEHGDDHDHDGHEDHGDEGHGDDHDHDFESLGEAVKEIKSLRTSIGDDLAKGEGDDAHGQMHHLFEVLAATEKVIQAMEESDAKTESTAAIESLLDDFSSVDATMHGGEGKEMKDVAESIDNAIATLEKNAG